MCARRFLFAVFLLTLLVVGGAFAIYQFGGSILVRQAAPSATTAERTRLYPDG
jgi:hypothetical protein